MMTRSRGMTLAAALVAGLTIPAVSLAGTASAALVDKGPIIGGTWGPDVYEEYCGVPGLTVIDTGTEEGWYLVKSTGTDPHPLMTQYLKDTEVQTNLANGRTVTRVVSIQSHETSVTYGDGTYTLHIMNTGHTVWYDDAGAVIGRDSGQFSYEPTFNDSGTPTDYSDDVKLGPATVVKVTGHRETITEEGYCGVVVPALT